MADSQANTITVKDLNTENPRWCAGCGDFGITMAIKRFMVDRQLQPHETIHVSGIGCSGRAPNYYNTYGIHSVHGRAITLATGLALSRPDLQLFIHSGDGDALSIGGNHLLHGINKNFNCVFVLYNNQLYALTKMQTSPTTARAKKTNTQPAGTYLEPIKVMQLVLGMGVGFAASTADWMPDHMSKTLAAAFDHKGFSFVHVSQRCPHFDPNGFDYKNADWFSFLDHEKGIAADKRLAEKTEVVRHDPSDFAKAFEYAMSEHTYYGLFYHNPNKPCYDVLIRQQIENTEQKDRTKILDDFIISNN